MQKVKDQNKSIEAEKLLKLIGENDNMRELSSLAIEPKEEDEWKEQLSRFI